MKRALLLIDRGSREPEAKEELSQLCTLIKEESKYAYVDPDKGRKQIRLCGSLLP